MVCRSFPNVLQFSCRCGSRIYHSKIQFEIDKIMFMLELNVEFKLADGVAEINYAYAPWCEFDSHLSSPLTTNYLTHERYHL